MIRSFHCNQLGLVVALLLGSCEVVWSAPNRTNVVFIMLDNVGQEWFGCYGSEEGCTPNIDRLAKTGVRVENCYTPPVCGPSRTVLLTGRYPHSTGFRLHHDAALYSGGGLDPQREVLFPRLFRDAGYATCIAGKWQVNNLYDEPGVLTRHGFQEQLVWPGSIDRTKVAPAEFERFRGMIYREAYEEAVAFNTFIESRYWDPVFLRNGRREVLSGQFGPDAVQSFALDFIRKNRDKPFMLYMPMMLTHGQNFTQSVVPTPLNKTTDRPKQEMFGDMLRYADKLIGELVGELERLELRDNTIVFIASDNGTEKHFHAKRNGRVVQGDLYSLTEAGGNVVLMANSPKLIPGGRTLPLADFSDIYPTLCELASVPLSPTHTPDGRSFAAYLLAKQGAKPPRDWILNEYNQTRVVRDERFKLYSDGRLFDANKDPEEKIDLAKSTDAVAVTAREKLEKALALLPADQPSPFLLRSLSGFKIRSDIRANPPQGTTPPPLPAAPLRFVAELTDKKGLLGAHDIQLQDQWAFVAGKGGSVAIIDVKDPEKPRMVWNRLEPKSLEDAETVLPLGKHLLVGTRDVVMFDIADLRQPQLVSTLSNRLKIDRINGFAQRGDVVFAANKNGSIVAIDIKPKVPTLLGAYSEQEKDKLVSPHDIAVLGDFIVTVDANGFGRENRPGRLVVLRVADPATHQLLPAEKWERVGVVESVDLAGANRIHVAGHHAFVGASISPQAPEGRPFGKGIIIDLKEPAKPRVLSVIDFNDRRGPNGSALAGKVWFLAGGQTVEAIDISDPSAPRRAATIHSVEAFPTADDNAHDLVYRDGYLYVTSQSDHRLAILKVDDPVLRTLADAKPIQPSR